MGIGRRVEPNSLGPSTHSFQLRGRSAITDRLKARPSAESVVSGTRSDRPSCYQCGVRSMDTEDSLVTVLYISKQAARITAHGCYAVVLSFTE